jgi:uncharacterized protein (TIGR03067 family)
MKRLASAALLFGLLSALAGGRAEEEAAAPDRERLQGTWAVVSAERGGKAVEEAAKDRLVFTGDKIRVVGASRARNEEGTFQLHPDATPRGIDIETAAGKQPKVLGIYRLKGDELTLCLPRPGDERPGDFETASNPRLFKAVLKRAKPEP